MDVVIEKAKLKENKSCENMIICMTTILIVLKFIIEIKVFCVTSHVNNLTRDGYKDILNFHIFIPIK